MRSCSPRRATATTLLVGGGVLLLLLLLFSVMGVTGISRETGQGGGSLPTKLDRFGARGGVAAALDHAGEGGSAGGGIAAEEAVEGSGSTLAEAAARINRAEELAGEEELEEGGVGSNLSRLRRRLLERAGYLALHGEDPAKNLVLVAQTFYRGGDQEAAMEWFERARRRATDPDNTTNSSVALRAVVKGLLSVGEFREAELLVGQIPLEAERERARAEVATSLARKKYFAEAVRIASSLSDPRARALGLRGVADAQARYGDLQEAVNTVNAIPAGRWQDDAWMRVALARAGKGDTAGAAMVLGRISNDRTRDLAAIKVAEAQARSGGTGSIEILLSALNDPFLRDQSLRRVVEARVQRLDYARAEDSVHWITNSTERALAMEALVGLQVQVGDLTGAFLRARDIELPEARARALQAVAIGMTKKRGTQAGRNVADLINDPKERDLTYRRVAERSAFYGRTGEALDTVYLIEQPDVRASALAELAQWRARRGAVSPARLLLQDAVREVEQIPKLKHQERALGILATAHAEARDSAAAMSTAASIGNAGLRDRAYQQLSRKFAAVSDIQLAEQSALAIKKEETREKALDVMAQMIAGKTPPNRALGVVGQFESRRQQVKFLVSVAGRI